MQPLFLQGSRGRLFVLYFPPQSTFCRGHVLYVHPFAEELNKSRRMVVLQARALAARGWGVLLPDLYGCGDSDGSFGQARWALWQEDLRCCLDWLRQRDEGPLTLWGLRLGGTLAAELCRSEAAGVSRLLLWQPVEEGRRWVSQFLRLRAAAANLAGGRESVEQLRQQLTAGQCVEVAGYELHPELAAALDEVVLMPPADRCRIDWFELRRPGPERPPRGALAAWKAAGIKIETQVLPGEPFWATQEIALAPTWLTATTAILTQPS